MSIHISNLQYNVNLSHLFLLSAVIYMVSFSSIFIPNSDIIKLFIFKKSFGTNTVSYLFLILHFFAYQWVSTYFHPILGHLWSLPSEIRLLLTIFLLSFLSFSQWLVWDLFIIWQLPPVSYTCVANIIVQYGLAFHYPEGAF